MRCVSTMMEHNEPTKRGSNLSHSLQALDTWFCVQGGVKFCTWVISPGKISWGRNFATLGIPKTPNCFTHTFISVSDAERFANEGHWK